MSSNYRFFVQFLCEGIANASGTRQTAGFYKRLRNVNAREQYQNRVTNEQFQQSPQMIAELEQKQKNGAQTTTTSNPMPRPNTTQVNTKKKRRDMVDDTVLVLEGIRQYSDFMSKNGPRRSHWTATKESIQSKPLETAQPKDVRPPRSPKTEFRTSQLPPIIEFQSPIRSEENFDPSKPSLRHDLTEKRLKKDSKETKVPSTRTARAMSFGGLALNLGVGAVGEFTKRLVGASNSKSTSLPGVILSEANAIRIVDTLCRVRGAALKLGQMLSIQDSDVLGPELSAIFERVRQSADYMPVDQMEEVLKHQLGPDWRDKFAEFENVPFAAASIGQVHMAKTKTGESVAVKIQYPGVAESIESDIKNVLMILKYANVFPDGLFIDHIMAYAKKELSWEVDYVREAQCAIEYRRLVEQHFESSAGFYVPRVYPELSSKRVLTNEFVPGIAIDKLDDFRETARQSVKNTVVERLLKLFFVELFQFNYMQTDPNWSNFLYDYEQDRLSLIDFGSARPYSPTFVQQYFGVLQAAIDNDRDRILQTSLDIGFLSGYEADAFKRAHVDSVAIIGEALRTEGEFDFGEQSMIKRIQELIPVMLQHRLQPPPEEIYSLHRKLSGLFLLCTKMKVQIRCQQIFKEAIANSPTASIGPHK